MSRGFPNRCVASLLLDDLDPHAVTALAQQVNSEAATTCVIGIRHLGGALARSPQTPNALGHRAANYSLGMLSLLGTSEPDTVTALHEEALAGFAPHVLGRSLNFTFGRSIKSKYAPHTSLPTGND